MRWTVDFGTPSRLAIARVVSLCGAFRIASTIDCPFAWIRRDSAGMRWYSFLTLIPVMAMIFLIETPRE
jgi:hypothetical protein